MNEDEARDMVLRLIGEVAPELDPAGMDPDADIREEIDIDSMDFLALVERLHEKTGLHIPERDYAKLATLNGWIAYLSR